MEHTRCIATSSDSCYFPALMALLRSLEASNPSIPVVVLDGGLTDRQSSEAGKYARVMERVPFMKIKGRGKFEYIGHTTMLKFEAAELEYDRVLYLDADMIVLDALDTLFEIPAGAVGVVKEKNSLKNMFRLQHRRMLEEDMDIDWVSPGFNAGLFVLRPSEWKYLKDDARCLVRRFGEDVFSKSKDQQLLNVLFRGKTFDLPPEYNVSPYYDEDVSTPAVIHYLGPLKPWHEGYPDEGRRYDEFRMYSQDGDGVPFSGNPEVLCGE